MAIYKFDEQKQKNKKTDYQKIIGCIFVAVSIFCIFGLITQFMPIVKSFLLGIAGLFCYPFFITLLAIGFALIGHKRYVMPKKYGIFLSLSIIFVLAIIQLIMVKNNNLSFWDYLSYCYTKKITAGGFLLGLLVAPFLYILNRLGAFVIFITASIIMIALTIDYIHYLSKNEVLKKSITVSASEQSQPIKNLTVKDLEEKLKQEKQTNQEKVDDKPKEKVKITLDAKVEENNTEESAKRKLGLLASSKTDQIDNSRYFNTPKQEEKSNIINNPKEYILSGKNEFKLSEYSKNQLSKIQENLMSLKNGTSTKVDTVKFNTNNILIQNKEPEIIPHNLKENIVSSNYSNFNTIRTENTLPNKVVHEEYTSFVTPLNKSSEKSIIGNNIFSTNNENIVKDDELTTDNNDILNSINPVKNLKEEDDVIIPNKTIDSLDVESFTNNILASLNKKSEEESDISSNQSDIVSSSNYSTSLNTVNYSSPNNMFKEEQVEITEPITPKPIYNYTQPPIDLLTTKSMDLTLINQDVVMKREELEITLDTFGIPAKVIGVVIGPAVTRYELEMPAGVSVKRLTALQDDIAYSLQSNGAIRMETPIPGRKAVGIEVPNEKIATVGLKDIIMSDDFMRNKSNLSIALGKDISGEVKTFSLVKIPHLLIAGTTGSGKSVCINAIILSLIYKYSPDEIKFILVDPKRVEFSMYNNLPHLLTPNVITDNEKALNALSWCVDEMERRFITFANARVKNLEEYNSSEDVLEGKAEKIPYIIFIIDELADLLMTSKKEAEDYICRILQKARAAGIHMILATQRPSVDVVTGKIKANLNARICFALMTFADSKTVLDQGGAERLLGKGDMLFMSSDTGVPKRIQGCYITTQEIDDVVTYIKENNSDYEFDMKVEQSILNPPKNNVVSQVDGDRASRDGFDSLMPQVLKAVIETGHASISMIQRKFLVGFPRAGKIIDQMEREGYISPSDGSKSRSVYITREEYEKLYGDFEG